MFALLAACIADRSLGFALESFEPNFAATVISLESFEKILERSLSAFPFLCLIPAQCECPAINYIFSLKTPPNRTGSILFAKPVFWLALTINPEIVASPKAG